MQRPWSPRHSGGDELGVLSDGAHTSELGHIFFTLSPPPPPLRHMSLLALSRQASRRRPCNENLPGSPSPVTPSHGGFSTFSSPASPRAFGGTPPLVIPHTHAPFTVAQRVAFGERILKKFKIDEGKMGLIREYWETTHPEERGIFEFMMAAANHDETTALAIQTAEGWKPTAVQTSTIRKSAQLVVLLPDLAYFTGALGQLVVQAITSKIGHGFPTDTNEAAFETFVCAASRQVTLALSRLKTTIACSIADKKYPERPAIHLHELAEDILTTFAPKLKTKLSHSLDFYHHIAFLRHHVQKDHPSRAFWDNVDTDREEMNTASPEEYIRLDQERFPPRVNAPAYSLRPDIFGGAPKLWHEKLVKLAKAVTRVSPGSVKKRKRLAVEEEEEDQEEEEEHDEPLGGVLDFGQGEPTDEDTTGNPSRGEED
ncbi:hypothetical protein GGX14DRAFT_395857 [Mycena pura]|uniref:Uncharacterized protein n=1 Tax=Mycena pura TaxID=153505 RepID=A0AAD6YG43_9AGAR|nr:hypothetical protein GGX14DRAFT_395857 [Mycena pura]